MSYLVGNPERSLRKTAYHMYTMYPQSHGYDQIRYVQCTGAKCIDCDMDEDLYRVCPTCGSNIAKVHCVYECTCGTVIYACAGRRHGAIITAYVTQNKLFRIEEDII